MTLLDKARQWALEHYSDAAIPARIETDIRRQQDASEILIGWIQLGILATWAVLYAVTPKTFTDEADFAPVPWALGAYFLFTLTRLFLAHRRSLPQWFLVLSVMVDMALLLGLIWSFHLQY